MAVDKQRLWFGVGLGDWSGADVAATQEIVRHVVQADRDGLDLFAAADHPYFEGQVYRVSRLEPAPVPVPPIWTGAVGPKSLAVTGRLADGWVPGRAADWLSAGYRESRPVIDEAAAAAGRDPAEIVTVYNFGGPITDSLRSPARDADGRWLGGTVRQWIDELTGAVVDHGASGFVYRAPDGIRPDIALGRWAHEIVPAVRGAASS